MMRPGARVTVDVLKPAAGGRMLARHDGQVLLLWGGIPGERVVAVVDRVGKGVLFGEVVEVERASPDRQASPADWRCGGHVLGHVRYARQLALKGEIVADAFGRIGRLPLTEPPPIEPSPVRGYRMRARLHVKGGRIGFVREGTHEVCAAGPTEQLSDGSAAWLAEAPSRVPRPALDQVSAIELAESMDGSQRAAHLSVDGAVPSGSFDALAAGLTGLSQQGPGDAGFEQLHGSPVLSERISPGGPAGREFEVSRHVQSFFQGNRFLVNTLVRRVLDALGDDPLLDLYAGVGLFGLAAAAAGREGITLVEGDARSAADLQRNALAWGAEVRPLHRDVESFLSQPVTRHPRTVILDPPRTGLSKGAAAGLIRLAPATIVYVSCDVATVARDARALVDAGYQLRSVSGLDLFPQTAHVETVAVFGR